VAPTFVGATVMSACCPPGLTGCGSGYDVAMSEPTSESPSPDSSEGDDDRLIPDEKLPDDLNPEKNPLAAEPDDDAEGGFSPNTPDAPGS